MSDFSGGLPPPSSTLATMASPPCSTPCRCRYRQDRSTTSNWPLLMQGTTSSTPQSGSQARVRIYFRFCGGGGEKGGVQLGGGGDDDDVHRQLLMQGITSSTPRCGSQVRDVSKGQDLGLGFSVGPRVDRRRGWQDVSCTHSSTVQSWHQNPLAL